MTTHDPRVTLTEAEKLAMQRALNGPRSGSVAGMLLTRAVEQIIAARLAPIRAVAEQWDTGCAREVLAALDATGADLRASQDHDGTHGPPRDQQALRSPTATASHVPRRRTGGPVTAYRPRWRTDATGHVARMAGEWAGPTFTDLDALTDLLRQMPNGGQVEIVEVPGE